MVVEPFGDLEEAVRIANATRHGLTASVLAGDRGIGVQVANRLEAGVINVNSPSMCAELGPPIGGVEESGAALFGIFAAEQFLERVTITVNDGPPNHRL